jgi:transposase-like protein
MEEHAHRTGGLAYLWADGIYVKAGIGKEKAALLVVIGVQKDLSKRFLALELVSQAPSVQRDSDLTL